MMQSGSLSVRITDSPQDHFIATYYKFSQTARKFNSFINFDKTLI